MKNKNYGFYVIIIIAFVILFIASAIIFKVYNIDILPSQFFGALIGVFITAIVTAFLLNGQTKSDEERERNVKVFEKKLEVYQRVFNVLEEITQERQINEAKLNKLIFQIGHIRMHTTKENAEKQIKALKEFVECVNFKKIEEGNNAKLTERVIALAETLREELYDSKNEKLEVNLAFMDEISQASLIRKLKNKMPHSKNFRIWTDNINDIRLVYDFEKTTLAADTYFEKTKCLQEIFYRTKGNNDIVKLRNGLNEDKKIRGVIIDSQKEGRFIVELVSTELEDIATEIQENCDIIEKCVK